MITADQALTFVAAASKGAPRIFFDAHLGAGRTPTIEDFKSDDAERLGRAEDFLECVQSVTDALVEHLRNQPRQTSLLTGFDERAAKPPAFNPTADDGKPIHEKPKKKPTPKKTPTAKAKKASSMSKKTPAKKGTSK